MTKADENPIVGCRWREDGTMTTQETLPGMRRSYDDSASGFVGVPYSRTETSKAAAETVVAKAPIQRQRVWQVIHRHGGFGLTAEEISVYLQLDGNSVRPRLVELVKSGRVIKTEVTRKTSSGRQARVYVAVEATDEPCEDCHGHGWIREERGDE